MKKAKKQCIRMNIDVVDFYTDERINDLAEFCEEDRLRAEARIMRVWARCYTNKSEYLDAETADQQAKWRGSTPLVELMARAKLAARSDEVDCEGRALWRIRGVQERIQHLVNAARWGLQGANARWHGGQPSADDGAPIAPDAPPMGADGEPIGSDGAPMGEDGDPIGDDRPPTESGGGPIGSDGEAWGSMLSVSVSNSVSNSGTLSLENKESDARARVDPPPPSLGPNEIAPDVAQILAKAQVVNIASKQASPRRPPPEGKRFDPTKGETRYETDAEAQAADVDRELGARMARAVAKYTNRATPDIAGWTALVASMRAERVSLDAIGKAAAFALVNDPTQFWHQHVKEPEDFRQHWNQIANQAAHFRPKKPGYRS